MSQPGLASTPVHISSRVVIEVIIAVAVVVHSWRSRSSNRSDSSSSSSSQWCCAHQPNCCPPLNLPTPWIISQLPFLLYNFLSRMFWKRKKTEILKTKKTGICESMLCGTQCVQCDMLAVFGIWIDSIYYVVWSIRYLDHVGIQNHDNNLLRERIWSRECGKAIVDIGLRTSMGNVIRSLREEPATAGYVLCIPRNTSRVRKT